MLIFRSVKAIPNREQKKVWIIDTQKFTKVTAGIECLPVKHKKTKLLFSFLTQRNMEGQLCKLTKVLYLEVHRNIMAKLLLHLQRNGKLLSFSFIF